MDFFQLNCRLFVAAIAEVQPLDFNQLMNPFIYSRNLVGQRVRWRVAPTLEDGPHASPKGLRHGFGVTAVSKGIALSRRFKLTLPRGPAIPMDVGKVKLGNLGKMA
jgi:hypothetical protein